MQRANEKEKNRDKTTQTAQPQRRQRVELIKCKILFSIHEQSPSSSNNNDVDGI